MLGGWCLGCRICRLGNRGGQMLVRAFGRRRWDESSIDAVDLSENCFASGCLVIQVGRKRRSIFELVGKTVDRDCIIVD